MVAGVIIVIGLGDTEVLQCMWTFGKGRMCGFRSCVVTIRRSVTIGFTLL